MISLISEMCLIIEKMDIKEWLEYWVSLSGEKQTPQKINKTMNR